jgi:hypothetical protein
MPSPEVTAENAANAAAARNSYIDGLDHDGSRDDWHTALREARRIIAEALRASDYLTDPKIALLLSGTHMTAFRHLLAPPLSQDQFKLICPAWNKGTEKSGRPLSEAAASATAAALLNWLDPGVAPWLAAGRRPNMPEVRNALQRTAALIASQRIQTVRRNRHAVEQEDAVKALLTAMGWTQRPSKQIDTRAELAPRTFMHKTRFATATSTPQEVDIACGLNGTYVAAIECKVTNDETNSVKRINDVIKKAEAWKVHWGSFVETVAVLQGVIGGKDVDRLCDANVRVFWSHDIEPFRVWISSRV